MVILFSRADGLSNFRRGHYEERFCEISLNLDQWFRRRCHSKDISYLETRKAFCSAERNRFFFCNLVKDIMGNIHVNYFAFGLGVLGENVI